MQSYIEKLRAVFPTMTHEQLSKLDEVLSMTEEEVARQTPEDQKASRDIRLQLSVYLK